MTYSTLQVIQPARLSFNQLGHFLTSLRARGLALCDRAKQSVCILAARFIMNRLLHSFALSRLPVRNDGFKFNAE